MGTPYDKNNPLHALIIGPNGPIPQKYDPEANSGQGGMVPSTVDDVQKVTQTGSNVSDGSSVEGVSFVLDDEGYPVLRIVDSAPFAYDEANDEYKINGQVIVENKRIHPKV